jgi:hypothetical protein
MFFVFVVLAVELRAFRLARQVLLPFGHASSPKESFKPPLPFTDCFTCLLSLTFHNGNFRLLIARMRC